MGIINSHITLPVMRMLDQKNLHVLDTSKYYTKLYDNVKKWMI